MTSVVYLEVRPSSTSDDFPSRMIQNHVACWMIIGNCQLIPIWRTISVTPFAIYKQLVLLTICILMQKINSVIFHIFMNTALYKREMIEECSD